MDCRPLAVLLLLTVCGCGKVEDSSTVTRNESKSCSSAEIQGEYLITHKDGSRVLISAVNDEALRKEYLEPNAGSVLFAEPHYQIASANEFETTSSIETQAQAGDWGLDAAGFRAAWDQGMTGQGILVAIVDSGVDIRHIQISSRLQPNISELNGAPDVDDDNNGYIDDIYGYNFSKNIPYNEDVSGHGTHVAGIVLADPSRGRLSGGAPGANLLPLDFMSYDSEYRQELGTTADAITALDYAARNGAKVINASWGGTMCSLSLQSKFNELQNRDIFIAVAAGNSGADISYSPAYPAIFQGINQITVGALDSSGIRARYSNYGALVQLLAPGTMIESTVPTSVQASGYAFQSGTSMASPFVAAAAAILRAAFPFQSATEIRQALLDSADPTSTSGYPRAKLRVDKAIQLLQAK